jgi:hypothetical protein
MSCKTHSAARLDPISAAEYIFFSRLALPNNAGELELEACETMNV